MAWSSDGSKIAFVGTKGKRAGIYTASADGSHVRFVPGTRGGENPVFSPGGRRIAFTRQGRGWALLFSSTPWIVNVDGSGARRLLGWRKYVTYTPSSFSPDGRTLAATRGELGSDKPKILLLPLNRRRIRPLVERASEAAFSPDGSWIVFVRHLIKRHGKFKVTHKDLFAMSVDGERLKRLTRTPWVAETHPDWDPSGQRIAFSSFRISRNPIDRIFDELVPVGNSIAQMNTDGTCREKLLSLHRTAIYGVKWQPGPGREAGRIECRLQAPAGQVPAGPRLAVVKFKLLPFRFDLETVDQTGALSLRVAGGGEWRRPLPEWFTAPTWSPDGSRIAFAGLAHRIDGGPRGTRLYVSYADGSGLRPLRGTHGADEPVFTRDGTAVAFTRYHFRRTTNRRGEKQFVERGGSVWMVDLAGGVPRRITPRRTGLFMWPSSFSPDGRALLLTRQVRYRQDVVALRLGTGRTNVLLRHALDPVYSPDGSKIAFLRWHRLKQRDGTGAITSDLFTVKAGGGGLRRVTKSRKDDRYPSWDPSGERLAFVRYRPEVTRLDKIGMGSALMQANSDGSCLRTVLRPSRAIALYGAAWQPGPGREAGRIGC